jgi:hypothetical protein
MFTFWAHIFSLLGNGQSLISAAVFATSVSTLLFDLMVSTNPPHEVAEADIGGKPIDFKFEICRFDSLLFFYHFSCST